MYDVFISYAREDKKRVKRLVDVLVEERGWSIWFDEALRAGDEFPRVIQETLEQVRCVLVVWSKDAVGSRWVIAEATEGWNRGILVPVRLDDLEPPLPFRQTEATDFSDWKGSARSPALLKLIEAIERAPPSGARPNEAELVAREQRRRAFRQRKLVRRVLAGVAAAALVAGGWFGWEQLESRGEAERLAERAAQLRAEILQLSEAERGRTWGSVLSGSEERLDKLDVATLLAAEAVRRARTDRTEQVLGDLIAMSPWSDKQLELDDEIEAARFNADGTVIVAGGGVGDTLVWTPTSDRATRIPHGGMGGAQTWTDRRGARLDRGGSTIDVEATGARVATAGPDMAAAVWDARSGQELKRLPHESIVTALAFVPNTDSLATVSENGIVRVWDLASGQEELRREHGGDSYWIAVSRSGRHLVSTSGRTARVWATATGIELARLEHSGPVLGARFSQDETLVVTYGNDIETTVWAMPGGGTVRQRIPVSAGDRAGALFGPDGRTLVIGSTDGTLRWWGLDQNQEQLSQTVGQFVLELQASANGERFVAAGNPDNIASARAFADGRELRQMPYWGRLKTVAISPDGRLMASSGSDGGSSLLEVTEVRPDDPLAAACGKARRNLTPEEWREHIGAAEAYRPTCPRISDADADAK